ncbi:hypothetical protein GCM10027049_15810 [Mucilaginibacter puniceus]
MYRGRKLILFCCLLCVFSLGKSFAQQKNSISYIIPEIVNVEIDNYLKTIKSDEGTYIILQNQNDTTSILVSSYAGISKLVPLIKNSNRYIKVGISRLIPVLLRPDLLLSSNLHIIKNKGTEYEAIETTLIGAGGYLIVYKGLYHNPKLIKAEYFQN